MKHNLFFFTAILLNITIQCQEVEIIFTNKTAHEKSMKITLTMLAQRRPQPGFVSVPTTAEFRFLSTTITAPHRETIEVEGESFDIDGETFSIPIKKPGSTFLLFAAVQESGNIQFRSPFNNIIRERRFE